MVDLHQVRVQWTSTVGIDGVSTFYCTGTISTFLADIRVFFEAIKGKIADEVTIVYPSTGNNVDSVSGQVTSTWAVTAPAVTVCTGPGNYSRAAGAVINWRTGQFVNGRELRGKTFLVPIVSGSMDSSGNLDPLTVIALRAAGQGLKNSTATMVIYSKTAHTNGAVTDATVPNMTAVLRSRR
jgi:hypothetical protein